MIQAEIMDFREHQAAMEGHVIEAEHQVAEARVETRTIQAHMTALRRTMDPTHDE